jgi:hypothetical protein
MSRVERLAASAGAPPVPNQPLVNAIPLQSTAPASTLRAVPGTPFETSSLPAVPGKAEAKIDASTAAAVQLGTGPSVDALRLNWSMLSQRHQAMLQKLQPRYTASHDQAPGGTGTAYDLIAGPLPNIAEAQKLCDALRAQYVSCRVGTFGGNAL